MKTFLGRYLPKVTASENPNRHIKPFSEDFGEQPGEERRLV